MPLDESPSRGTILLVEDEAIIAMATALRLEREGYRVLQSRTGEKAVELALARPRQVDLVLMDIDLGPGMDGTEAARLILAERDLPVVFVSSHVEKSIVDRTREITSYGYVVKNSGDFVLLASIDMAFRLHAERLRVAEEERRFRETIDYLQLLAVQLDPDARVVYCNDYLLSVTGRSEAESIGASWFDLFLPERLRPTIRTVFQDIMRTGTMHASHENPILTATGEERVIRWSNVVLRDKEGRPCGVSSVGEDVTETRKAAAERDMLAHAVRSSVNEIYIFDAETLRFAFVNDGAARNLGFGQDELAAMTPVDLEPRHDETGFRALLAPLADGSTPSIRFEAVHRRKDGSDYPIEANVQTMEAGGRGLYMAVVLDITERKSRERETDRFFRTALDLLCIADLEGRFLKVNPEWERVLGRTTEELEGSRFLDFVHPDDLEPTLKEMEALGKGHEVMDFTNRYRAADGSWRTIEWRSVSPEGNLIYAAARDVTDREKKERLLRDGTARWKFALDGAGDGLWDWDAPSGRVYYSRRWKEMLGYRDEEIGDGLDEWEKRVHPDDLAPVKEALARHFAGETDIYLSEHRLKTADGSWKWILDRGKIVERAQDGSPLRVIGTHTDIDDRKRLELRLEAAVRERDVLLEELRNRPKNP